MVTLQPEFEDPDFFWKNFRLGTELHVSGAFIYDALLLLDKMEHFNHEDECFTFLYYTAVGIERLEKIAIILLEHNPQTDQEKFEKSLITHNHLELIYRIKRQSTLKLGKVHNKFLQLLSDFYKTYRYDRYNLSSVFHPNQDKTKLTQFICDELQTKDNDCSFFTSEIIIDTRIRHFIGKTISKISTQLFEIIEEQARHLRLYTYEIRYESKAFKIFVSKEYSFDDERQCQKEVLVYLMNKKNSEDVFTRYVNSIKPLDLEGEENNTYARFLFDFSKETIVTDEISQIYEDNEYGKDRTEAISLIGEDISFEGFVCLDNEDELDE